MDSPSSPPLYSQFDHVRVHAALSGTGRRHSGTVGALGSDSGGGGGEQKGSGEVVVGRRLPTRNARSTRVSGSCCCTGQVLTDQYVLFPVDGGRRRVSVQRVSGGWVDRDTQEDYLEGEEEGEKSCQR